jgi:hypothetical protein
MNDRRVRVDGFLILPEYLNVAERLPQFEEKLDPVEVARQMLRDRRIPLEAPGYEGIPIEEKRYPKKEEPYATALPE